MAKCMRRGLWGDEAAKPGVTNTHIYLLGEHGVKYLSFGTSWVPWACCGKPTRTGRDGVSGAHLSCLKVCGKPGRGCWEAL